MRAGKDAYRDGIARARAPDMKLRYHGSMPGSHIDRTVKDFHAR